MIDREYAQRIIDACPVDVYLSANDGARVHWPWRMQPPSEANDRYVDHCQTYAVDSEPQSPSVTNKDVLDTAAEKNADLALLVDYFPFDVYMERGGPLFDRDGNLKDGKMDDLQALGKIMYEYDSAHEASIDSVLEGMKMAASHEYDGDLLIPLQAPYVESYRRLGEPDMVAIGGLKDAHASEKVEAAKELRNAATDAHIHGLGWGATDEVATAIRDTPKLFDSIDSRTAHADAMSHSYWSGDEVTTPMGAHTLGYLFEACRRMTPEMSDNPTAADLRDPAQSTLWGVQP